MANSMLALVKYSIAKKLSYTRVVSPGPGGHSVDDNFLALRLNVGHPAGQGVENGCVEADRVVHGDPEHVIVGVGQCWGEVHLRRLEVGETVAGVPVIL